VANNHKRKSDINVLIARGRLAEARKWFEHRGWEVLPQGERGRRILRWGADHARLADPANPKRSVRRWCRSWDPRLTVDELDELVAYTENSNKRWSADQCAVVLEITVRDRSTLGLRFIGAADDPNYEVRHDNKRAKDAERARRSRAARSTGAKRGRPKSEGVPAWEVLGISKATYFRWRKAGKMIPSETGMKSGRKPLTSRDVGETKNASRYIIENRKRDGISVSSDTGTEIRVTTPPADASGTTKQFSRVDGFAVVGNRERRHKTRFSTSKRLTREMRIYAIERGYMGDVENLFEMFSSWNLSMRTYSSDWDKAWRNWVDRQVVISAERRDRWRTFVRTGYDPRF
jgi:hypothetical protein